MTTVSPKHHKRWLNARRKLLQDTFKLALAEKFKKSLKGASALTKKWPKAKWSENVKSYAASLEEVQVVKTSLMKDFDMAQVVIHSDTETVLNIAFFSPVGDAFLRCTLSGKKLTWNKINLSESSLKKNRKQYLDKLSPDLKRQQGLIPPKASTKKLKAKS